MITAVITFAIITALVEGIILFSASLGFLLWKKGPLSTAGIIHALAFGMNLAIHWGTMTGSMTAMAALLVSFAVFPAIIWLKTQTIGATIRIWLKSFKKEFSSETVNRKGA